MVRYVISIQWTKTQDIPSMALAIAHCADIGAMEEEKAMGLSQVNAQHDGQHEMHTKIAVNCLGVRKKAQ